MSKRKSRILNLTNCIMHYSIPVYNMLSEHYDLTVAHYGNPIEKDRIAFKQIILSPKIIGPFFYFKENISVLAEEYDAVLAMGDLRVLPYILLGRKRNRSYALSIWGIGVSASYEKKFDEDKRLDWIRFRIMDRADSLIFYSAYPLQRYIDGGICKEKLFVAHNTVYVDERIDISTSKDYFLFVGSLYKEKNIMDLLNAYLSSSRLYSKIEPLLIVGDGDMRNDIAAWIENNEMTKHIFLRGAIYDTAEMKEIFRNALATISPGQAGLSVLNSMAHGVPFVTSYDAYTGGERFNIISGWNGILFDGKVENLSKILIELSTKKDDTFRMSVNAQNYYFENRTLEVLIDGLCNALEYAIEVHKRNSSL